MRIIGSHHCHSDVFFEGTNDNFIGECFDTKCCGDRVEQLINSIPCNIAICGSWDHVLFCISLWKFQIAAFEEFVWTDCAPFYEVFKSPRDVLHVHALPNFSPINEEGLRV